MVGIGSGGPGVRPDQRARTASPGHSRYGRLLGHHRCTLALGAAQVRFHQTGEPTFRHPPHHGAMAARTNAPSRPSLWPRPNLQQPEGVTAVSLTCAHVGRLRAASFHRATRFGKHCRMSRISWRGRRICPSWRRTCACSGDFVVRRMGFLGKRPLARRPGLP